MFEDTVTLFNRHGDMWYPTVIEGVYLQTDRASAENSLGWESGDKAVLHIPYTEPVVIAGKTYLEPKAWREADEPGGFITFAAGDRFDFFRAGVWEDDTPIPDADFPRGFYDHMNRTCDGVYAISSVSRFKALPHFEITGR